MFGSFDCGVAITLRCDDICMGMQWFAQAAGIGCDLRYSLNGQDITSLSCIKSLLFPALVSSCFCNPRRSVLCGHMPTHLVLAILQSRALPEGGPQTSRCPRLQNFPRVFLFQSVPQKETFHLLLYQRIEMDLICQTHSLVPSEALVPSLSHMTLGTEASATSLFHRDPTWPSLRADRTPWRCAKAAAMWTRVVPTRMAKRQRQTRGAWEGLGEDVALDAGLVSVGW